MRRLAGFLSVVLVSCIISLPVFGQTRMGPPPGLIVLSPEAPRSLEFQAEQLRQMLTVRLVNRGMYRVVSHLAVEAQLKIRSLTPYDLEVPETLATVARELQADYVLENGLSRTGDTGSWSLILTNAATGEPVWSTIIPVTPDRPMNTVRVAADQLDLFGRDVRMVQIQDIVLLLNAGEPYRAEELFRRYSETRTLSDADREVGDRIAAQQAQRYFENAQRFSELWLFDEALIEINRALALQPENQEYAAYVAEIREAQRIAEDADLTVRLTTIEELVDRGYYESAAILLEATIPDRDDKAGTAVDTRIETVRTRIEEAIGARRSYERALSAYWSGDYDDARAEVTAAIRRVPTRSEYGRLLDQIDRAAGNRESSEVIWESYRSRLSRDSIKGMLLGPVQVAPSWEVTVGGAVYSYRNRDTLATRDIDQVVAGGSYRRPYLLSIGQQSPIFSLYAGWHAGGSIRVGTDERDGDSGVGDGSRRINRETIWALGPAGGGFIQARLLGFSVSSGLELDNHLMVLQRLERDPAADLDRYDTRAAWVPSINWFTGLSWHWNDNNRVTVRYTTSVGSLVIPEIDSDYERYRPQSVVIGYGRSTR